MKTLGVYLLLLSTFILFGLGFDTNYQERLNLSLQAIKSSSSLMELADNPFHPQKVFLTFAEDTVKKSRLCKALITLAPADLALLEQYIFELNNEKPLPCYQRIVKLISTYHSVKSTTFIQIVEKNKKFLQEGGNLDEISWSPLNQFESVGPKRPHPFGGVSAVSISSVVYQRDLTTTSSEINKLNLNRGEIIFSFDDGPHPTRTNRVLEILDAYEIKALFFVLGKPALEHSRIVRNILDADHVVGSHSNTHKELPKLPVKEAEDEIGMGHLNMITATNGEDSGFFRFPYGSRNTVLAQYLKQNNLSSFFWNMDSLDWKYTDPVVLYNHVVSEVNREKKGILLFHDVHQQTVTVLSSVIENLYNAGYTIKVAVPSEWIESL